MHLNAHSTYSHGNEMPWQQTHQLIPMLFSGQVKHIIRLLFTTKKQKSF